MILNDVVGWRKRGASPADVGRLLEDAVILLARPFAGDRAALIKPSTVVNGLAAAMMSVRPEARAIVMYAPLEDFLTSIAKKGIDGRLWVRELFLAMRRETLVDGLGFGDAEFFGQTDLQIAAVAWLAQQRLFHQLVTRFPDRVRSLDGSRFLDQPRSSLKAAGKFLGLALSPDQLNTAEAERLSRNSKDGKPYGKGARQAEYRTATAAYRDEIEKVAAWARAVAAAASLPLLPGNPLT
jgi:hypothetical protein